MLNEWLPKRRAVIEALKGLSTILVAIIVVSVLLAIFAVIVVFGFVLKLLIGIAVAVFIVFLAIKGYFELKKEKELNNKQDK